MELEELIETMEIRMKARDLSDAYLSHVGASTREEIGIGEYAYGITMVPCDWVLPYLKQLEESIPKAVVGEKIEEIDYSYKNIEKNYTEEQLDNYDVSEEDYIEMEKREFAEMILQEILNKGE